MKRAVLVCWTSRGYCCLHCEYPSIAAARRAGREMVDYGFAFSFKIYPVKAAKEQEGEVAR